MKVLRAISILGAAALLSVGVVAIDTAVDVRPAHAEPLCGAVPTQNQGFNKTCSSARHFNQNEVRGVKQTYFGNRAGKGQWSRQSDCKTNVIG